MSKNKKQKIQWSNILVMGVMLLAGALCGRFMVRFLDASQAPDASAGNKLIWFGLLLLGMYVCLFIQLVIHEAGHLVFGLLTGYSFSSFRIGSFMWIKAEGKFSLKRLSIAGTGGQCLMVPPQSTGGEIPVTLYNLGGSLMNLAASFVFLLLCLALEGQGAAGVLLFMASLLGFALAATNGLPLRLGMLDNDGYNALSLRKNATARRAFCLQMQINAATAQGVRLKDMPEEWFTLSPDADLQNTLIATIPVLECNRLMDQKRFQEAQQRMARLLASGAAVSGLHRNLLLCDRIYIELIQAEQSDVTSQWQAKDFQKFMKSMKNFPAVLRTQYVYALLHLQDMKKAAAMKARFEKAAATYPYPSDIQSERELIALAEKVNP